MSDITVADELDCRGLSCPLPVVKTKKAIGKLTQGQVLKMTATDPGSANDMVSWSNRTGHKILESESNDGEYVFYIEHK